MDVLGLGEAWDVLPTLWVLFIFVLAYLAWSSSRDEALSLASLALQAIAI